MQSSAETVDDYVAHVDEEWRPVVERLRAACREQLHGYREVMAYGMPTYEVGGRLEIAFARQVRYLSLYVAKQDVLDAQRGRLQALNMGKGCVRFRRPDQVDWTVIDTLLRETVFSAEPPC